MVQRKEDVEKGGGNGLLFFSRQQEFWRERDYE